MFSVSLHEIPMCRCPVFQLKLFMEACLVLGKMHLIKTQFPLGRCRLWLFWFVFQLQNVDVEFKEKTGQIALKSAELYRVLLQRQNKHKWFFFTLTWIPFPWQLISNTFCIPSCASTNPTGHEIPSLASSLF